MIKKGKLHKILIVHNYYKERGGEDPAFEREAGMLEKHGHTVVRHVVRNEDIGGLEWITASLGAVWNRKSYREIQALIDTTQPDIVHIHNFFPLISPAAHHAAVSRRVAVVQTLHNFRLLCPNATFFRNHHVCEDCMGRAFQWPGIRHRCYRNSALASAAVAMMNATHHALGTWTDYTDAFIALSQFSRGKFIEGGLPAARLHVKPNFITVNTAQPQKAPAAGKQSALFVGRLSEEKGIRFLIDAWRNVENPLIVIGTGPLENQLRKSSPPNIHFMGQATSAQVLEAMRDARFLVFPSQCYENMSQVLVEALSIGLPIVASRLGGIPEVVEHGITGLLFEPGNTKDLENALNRAFSHDATLDAMSRAAHERHEKLYTEAINYQLLMKIYEAAINNSGARTIQS
ncbi:MAG: glycosyltransferase family 4 protein [Alphaproteobacteria bacterium]|nr:glycosyltransferase family 4 protein [Alphaproteobacteria bacterium]